MKLLTDLSNLLEPTERISVRQHADRPPDPVFPSIVRGYLAVLTCTGIGLALAFSHLIAGIPGTLVAGALASGCVALLIRMQAEEERRAEIAQGWSRTGLPSGLERRSVFLSDLRRRFEEARDRKQPFTFLIVSVQPVNLWDEELVRDPALHFVIAKSLRDALPAHLPVGVLGNLDFGVGMTQRRLEEGREAARLLRRAVMERVQDELSEAMRESLTVRTASICTEEGPSNETFEDFYRRADRALLGGFQATELATDARSGADDIELLPAALPSSSAWFGSLARLFEADSRNALEAIVLQRVRADLAFVECSRLDPGLADLERAELYTRLDLFTQSWDVDPIAFLSPDGLEAKDRQQEMLREVEALSRSEDLSRLEDVALCRIRATLDFLEMHRDAHEDLTTEELTRQLDMHVLAAARGA